MTQPADCVACFAYRWCDLILIYWKKCWIDELGVIPEENAVEAKKLMDHCEEPKKKLQILSTLNKASE